VSVEGDCRTAVEKTVRELGGLDVLYNNAGIFPADDHSVTDTEEKVWDRVLAVNVKGVAFCSKYAIPAMLRRGGGSVINVASFVAFLGCTVPQDAYTASKGAVIALTKSLAVQFGPHGIRANAICPGPIETPLLTEWLLKEPAEKAKRMNRIPMGRFGKPADVVNLAVYLASDESTWTNGAAILVDGGITSNYF
ncbi:MAG TPA: SDR family oxidoreductase, partial [Nitrospirales bacterium]|nr:SDR family oxidoreductase [Nitrospirales bacterium]